jgi:hypothetical protein
MAQKVKNRGVEVARRLKIWQEARCRERFKLRAPGAGGGADAVKKDHRRSCVAARSAEADDVAPMAAIPAISPGPAILGRLTPCWQSRIII